MLDFILNSQMHKSRDGFFLNHDNLMIATPEQRRRLIFYFIASQVPEKLNPADRSQFIQERDSELTIKSGIIGGALALKFGLSRLNTGFGTRLNRRVGLNTLYGFAGGVFCFYLGVNLTYNVLEPRFVAHNSVITDLVGKYNFTIFDFAQAKKEAHLKALRRELTSDQLLTGY